MNTVDDAREFFDAALTGRDPAALLLYAECLTERGRDSSALRDAAVGKIKPSLTLAIATFALLSVLAPRAA